MPPPARSEAEIAELRAEKSRKRKSQADKKLEDEVRSHARVVWGHPLTPLPCTQKTETINRLLNKQVGRASSSSSSTSPTPKAASSPGSSAAGANNNRGAPAAAGGGTKRSRSRLNKSITAGDHDNEHNHDYDYDEGGGAGGVGGDEALSRYHKRPRVEVKPLVARWISSIRPSPPSLDPAAEATIVAADGSAATSASVGEEEQPQQPTPTYRCTYSLPESRTSELAAFKTEVESATLAAPAPAADDDSSRSGGRRKTTTTTTTRVFNPEEREANRRRNREGWRAIMLGARGGEAMAMAMPDAATVAAA